MPQLIVQTEDGRSVVHRLGDGVVTVGRDTDNTIVIPDASVSRHHAELFVSNGATTFRDLRSANGSMVNYDLVTEAPLHPGDQLHFGLVLSTFAEEPAAESPKKLTAAMRRLFNGRRLLIGSAVVLVGVSATAALLYFQPFQAHGSLVARQAVVPGQAAKATLAFWDRLQQIEREANQQIRLMQLSQYPMLPNGIYDFQQIDNAGLERLLDDLTNRARYLARVSQDFAAVNPLHVDAELVAYGKELRAQWEGAARLDLDAVNLVWAVHERRLRYPATGAQPPENDDDAAADKETEKAKQENQAEISRIAKVWLIQRDQFVEYCAKITASEKAMIRLLLERYPSEFR